MIQNIIIGVLVAALIVLTVMFIINKKKLKKTISRQGSFESELERECSEARAEAKARTEFVANMSHEIRTPMNAICCATELLFKEELTPEATGYLNILKSSSDSLLGMVNDILDFSKIDEGKMSLINAEYSLSTILSDVKNIISVRLIDKPIAFTFNISPDIPMHYVGDEVRIKQILINLLGNAVKYTTSGEICLSVSAENLSDNRAKLSFAISDTGCGITPAQKIKLFERFEQADVRKHRYVEGSGLGLSICNQLVSLMGGKISFGSELGKGSVFKAEVIQELAPVEAKEIENSLQRLTVVLCEENEFYKANLEKMLSDMGIVARNADNSMELCNILNAVDVDFVITDESHYQMTVDAVNEMSQRTEVVKLLDVGAGIHSIGKDNITELCKPIPAYELQSILSKQIDYGDSDKGIGLSDFSTDAKILMVDDNRVNLKVGKALLESFNARVTAVDSGYEALNLVKQGEHFDLIFMDHMMPGMDGIEASHKIKETSEKDTPIVALTANADSETETLLLEAGLVDYVSKPIVIRQLKNVLLKWLPKEKVFTEGLEETSDKDENRIFKPELGMSKVWNDKEIFVEILENYTERSTNLVDEIKRNTIAKNREAGLRELLYLSMGTGATQLPITVNETINIVNKDDETLFAEKVQQIALQNEELLVCISDYIKENRVAADLLFY